VHQHSSACTRQLHKAGLPSFSSNKIFPTMYFKTLPNSFALLLSLFISATASAKVWRVNSNTGVSADFVQISSAIQSNLVNNDDTLYVEGAATPYGYTLLNKRLVFIGAGYLLSAPAGNPGLQWNIHPAQAQIIDVDSLASGSMFIGMSVYLRINSNTDNLTCTRTSVFIDPLTGIPNSTAKNWTFNKCLLGGNFPYTYENLVITNSIALYGSLSLPNAINALIRNNVFVNSFNIANSYIANNIFLSSFTGTNSIVKYNIATSNVLPAGNNNLNNIARADLIVDAGSDDGRYQLKAGSPAIGAGEPINGITPDAGAFGTADPYRLSGIPPIPTIYALSVPVSIPASATSMTITFSTRSNN
jgi:hypothetical protein